MNDLEDIHKHLTNTARSAEDINFDEKTFVKVLACFVCMIVYLCVFVHLYVRACACVSQCMWSYVLLSTVAVRGRYGRTHPDCVALCIACFVADLLWSINKVYNC